VGRNCNSSVNLLFPSPFHRAKAVRRAWDTPNGATTLCNPNISLALGGITNGFAIEESRGSDVHNQKNFQPQALIPAFAFFTAQAMGQGSKESDLPLKFSFVGGTLTCTQFPSPIHVPLPFVERSRIKARLAMLLRESLDDDAGGIVNVPREE
jgi:hypothetical protein